MDNEKTEERGFSLGRDGRVFSKGKQKEGALVWGKMPMDKWETEGRGFSKGKQREGGLVRENRGKGV